MRRLTGLIALLLALLLAVVASVRFGSVNVDWRTFMDAFMRFDGSNAQIIVRQLRVPRTLVGISVGTALAVAGSLTQAVTLNPLADPGILGINAGAALAVVLAIFGLGIGSASVYVWFAFFGAAVAAVFVYLLGSIGREQATPIKLALAGATVAAFLSAMTSAVLVLDARSLDEFRFWVAGSLVGRNMNVLRDVLPFMAIGLAIAFASARALGVLSLGEDTAHSLGLRPGFVRLAAGLAVVLLAGSAIALAGPIGFVGLAVPHAARLLVGPDWRWIIAYSAVLGPILLLGADILGRVVAQPGEVQVGIMTAMIGAPVFIYLARGRRPGTL